MVRRISSILHIQDWLSVIKYIYGQVCNSKKSLLHVWKVFIYPTNPRMQLSQLMLAMLLLNSSIREATCVNHRSLYINICVHVSLSMKSDNLCHWFHGNWFVDVDWGWNVLKLSGDFLVNHRLLELKIWR